MWDVHKKDTLRVAVGLQEEKLTFLKEVKKPLRDTKPGEREDSRNEQTQ